MKIITLVPPFLLCVVALFFLTAMHGVYLLDQGVYLFSYRLGTAPISRVSEQETLSAKEQELIRRAARIRRFAVEVLGLPDTDSYTRLVRTRKSYLVDVVQAAGKLSVRPYMWHFPLVGSVPYRGYYRQAWAEKEASRLRASGLDVIVRRVDGFSTLGILADPLYSFMSSYSETALAGLIIHELAHAALFVKNGGAFNEEFATFVEQEGVLRYMQWRFGANSVQVRQVRATRHDDTLFQAYMQGLYQELDSVYRSNRSDEEKLRLKKSLLKSATQVFAERYDVRFLTDRYRWFETVKVNNALLSLYRSYTGDLSPFRALLVKEHGDLAATIHRTKLVVKGKSNPEDAIREAAR